VFINIACPKTLFIKIFFKAVTKKFSFGVTQANSNSAFSRWVTYILVKRVSVLFNRERDAACTLVRLILAVIIGYGW
jgi:hypothetical protein